MDYAIFLLILTVCIDESILDIYFVEDKVLEEESPIAPSDKYEPSLELFMCYGEIFVYLILFNIFNYLEPSVVTIVRQAI